MLRYGGKAIVHLLCGPGRKKTNITLDTGAAQPGYRITADKLPVSLTDRGLSTLAFQPRHQFRFETARADVKSNVF